MSWKKVRKILKSDPKLEQYKKDLQAKELILLVEKDDLQKLLMGLSEILLNAKKELKELENSLSNLKKNSDENTVLIKELNSKKSRQTNELNIIATGEAQKEADIFRLNSLINTYKENNDKLSKENIKITETQEKTNIYIKELVGNLYLENEILKTDKLSVEDANRQLQKTQEYLMKLKEAFKFIEYKYTIKDVMLYDEAIKVLDAFAGYYINEWLRQLSVIINDLLKNVNMEVEFNPTKEFIKIKNGNNELKYEMLSSGQRNFISSIFKLSILLDHGENDGIIVCDEGMAAMDEINFLKFVEICETLPFQYFMIYHGLQTKISTLNYINIERKNNISIIK